MQGPLLLNVVITKGMFRKLNIKAELWCFSEQLAVHTLRISILSTDWGTGGYPSRIHIYQTPRKHKPALKSKGCNKSAYQLVFLGETHSE